YERVGLPPDFVIYDELDAEDLLRYLMSTRFRDRPGAITHPGELYRNIQRAKADLAAQCPLRLGELRERVAGTFPAPLHDLILEYENELLAQRAVDFDNLVLFVRALFDEWPAPTCGHPRANRWEFTLPTTRKKKPAGLPSASSGCGRSGRPPARNFRITASAFWFGPTTGPKTFLARSKRWACRTLPW